MNTLQLTREQLNQIVLHAQTDAPLEACGLIAGDANGLVSDIIPIPNAAPDPVHSYYMDERLLASTLTDISRRGLELVGIYHSHPTGDSIPSQDDRALATYPNTAYVIVGLKPNPPRISAWTLNYGQVEALPIQLDQSPLYFDGEQSVAQKTAIVIAALLAFVVLILLSLSLLPPAPIIPR